MPVELLRRDEYGVNNNFTHFHSFCNTMELCATFGGSASASLSSQSKKVRSSLTELVMDQRIGTDEWLGLE